MSSHSPSLLDLLPGTKTMTQAESADQLALGPDGQLLEASKLVWFNNPDDSHPIQPVPSMHEGEYLTLSQFGGDLSSCDSFQIKLVNAHAQSVPLLVHNSQKPSLLRNSMRMESLVVPLSYPVMRNHLLNASDIPPMSHAAMPSTAPPGRGGVMRVRSGGQASRSQQNR